MGKGVNSCVCVWWCYMEEWILHISFIWNTLRDGCMLMWQQVSRYLQQVIAWWAFFFFAQAQTSFRVITVNPGCFQLCSSHGVYHIFAPEAYFPYKRQSICAGYFIVKRLFSFVPPTKWWEHRCFIYIYHEWFDWSFTVRGSWSTLPPADRVNGLHFILLSLQAAVTAVQTTMDHSQCGIVMDCYISCLVVLVILSLWYLKSIKKNGQKKC